MGGGPVPRGTLSNYCERCGNRVDVRGARPGEHDLGLDRINAAFRYCSTCQLFVGRACCWNADVLACSGCASPGSDKATHFPAAIKTRREFAIRRLADLTESVDDLQKVAKVLDARTTGGVALPPTSWSEAKDAASWLIARADTSRDAVARALWPPLSDRARDRFEQFREELADLMKAYFAARASVEQRLMAAGQPSVATVPSTGTGGLLRGWRAVSLVPALMGSLMARSLVQGWRAVSQVPALMGSLAARWLRAWRRVPVPPAALLGGVAAVLVIAAGVAILGGRGPEMAILGGEGSPDQTSGTDGGAVETQVPAATPAPDGMSEPPTPSVRASLDFDTLRVGALQGASDSITDIAGVPEVAPFPSPFDRSVRMVGSGTHQFCISIAGLEPREVLVAVDLFAGSLPFGAFDLTAIPSDGSITATGLPPELVANLLPRRWYHLSARWQPGLPGVVEVRDDQGGELTGQLAPASPAAPAATRSGVCFSASGMSPDGELMLDNLRVEQ